MILGLNESKQERHFSINNEVWGNNLEIYFNIIHVSLIEFFVLIPEADFYLIMTFFGFYRTVFDDTFFKRHYQVLIRKNYFKRNTANTSLSVDKQIKSTRYVTDSMPHLNINVRQIPSRLPATDRGARTYNDGADCILAASICVWNYNGAMRWWADLQTG